MNDYAADLSFNYFQPTRVVFGAGSVKDAGLECKRLGITRAVIVTDRVLRETSDAVQRVEAALGARLAGVFDGALPDAPATAIDAGADFARALGCDGLVSVGGGSAIDTAKGMAIVLTEGGRIRDHQGSQRLTRRQTPHLAIPTTAGTGSEVTMFAVVSDPEAREKLHFSDDHILPDAALLDPALTVKLPPRLTAATGMDALTHAIEAFTSLARNPLTDGVALHAIRLIAQWLPRAVEHGDDLVARGQMMLAANLAGVAFNSSGVGLAHAMAHVIGARHHVHHGTANAIVLPHAMRFNADELEGRIAEIGRALGVDPRTCDADTCELAAKKVAELVARVGLPTRLRDAGVPESDLAECAEHSVSDAAIVYNGKFAADAELLLGVYRAAY